MEVAIKGIVPPVVTPLVNDAKLDYKGVENLVEHLVSGGVHGLFILGTTGEGPSLKYSLRIELIKCVCERVASRIPVLVGITDASFKESIFIAEKSKEFGAQAAVLAPPFYFHISQTELYNYTDQLIQELPLPVYLYNQPSLTKVNFDLEIVNELIPRSEIIGFKDSSGDMIYFQKLRKLVHKFNISLLNGPEELLMESLLIGGNGGVPGGANIFPELYVKMYETIKNRDIEEALKLQEQILQLSKIVYSDSTYGSSSIISGIKYALSCLNICNDFVATPLHNINPERTKKIKQFLINQKV